MIKSLKKSIYLDYAATTPIDSKVLKAMLPFLREKFGNPSSLYKKGMKAKAAIDNARSQIASLIGARPGEIIFSAGGTESINLAIFGVAREHKSRTKKFGHIITSKIEHHAVLHSVQALEKEGFEVTYLDVDKQGFIDIAGLEKSIRPNTILVSVMYANNEIGTIEPIAQIGKLIKRINTNREADSHPRILFHTDACQAASSLNLNVNDLGVDLMSLNGSKIYGPKQVGLLYVRSGVKLHPLIFGGEQERGLRSGTENVAGIIGLAEALKISEAGKVKDSKRLGQLRDYFLKMIKKSIRGIVLNGPSDGVNRLPNNINLSIKGVEGEALMLYLDAQGICVSTGSACTSQSVEPSHVLMALGKNAKEAQSAVRITLGRQTTKAEIGRTLKAVTKIVGQLRKVTNIN